MSTLDMWLDGAIASAVATVFSNPFDVIRTRMQLQGELLKTGQYHIVYRNMFQGLIRVSREEGVVALQKGLCTAMVWQVALNGVRVGLYPIAQSEVSLLCGQEYFLGNVAAGSICGFIGSYISSPFNLIKTRMQAMRNTMISLHGTTLTVASTGEQYAYKNLLDALRRIYSQNGIRGLWHGSCIAAQRSMVGSGAQLSTYELTKQYVCFYFDRSPADFVVHLFSAFTAALFVVIFMNPLDVVMTRSFNHDVRSANTYSANLALATWKIYRIQGIHGLYKGSEALFMRSAPHTIVTFVTLQWLRKMRQKWFSDRSYTSGSVLKNKTSGVARDNNNITNSSGDIKDNALQPTPELSKINKTMPMQQSTSSSSHQNFFAFVQRMAVSFSANACAEHCQLSDYTDTMKELTSAP